MTALTPSPSKPGPAVSERVSDDACDDKPASISTVPDDMLGQIFACLPQNDRAATALVCQRWAAVSRVSACMWHSVTLELWLCRPAASDRAESFVQWLLPRVHSVVCLTVSGRSSGNVSPLASPPGDVWSDVVGALALAGPHLQDLSVEWPTELLLSGWAAALVALRCASFSAPQVTVRPGLGFLTALQDLRFRSTQRVLHLGQQLPHPLGWPPPSPPGVQLLPRGLLNLRMDGCSLTSLPPSVAALLRLTDLVLSNNSLQPTDLDPLSSLTSLRQLTLMGTRMLRMPPALSALTNLRVLYLDGVAGSEEHSSAEHICDVLGPLRRLGVLSLGSSRLQTFPLSLATLTSLRALYLDNNPQLGALPDGPCLKRLRVLGVDWRVLFASHAALRHAPLLYKLCLTSFGGVENGNHSEEDASDVACTLVTHPGIRQVLLPMVDGNRLPLFLAPLNVALRLAACSHIEVRAVTYGGISNEWMEWLEGTDEMDTQAENQVLNY